MAVLVDAIGFNVKTAQFVFFLKLIIYAGNDSISLHIVSKLYTNQRIKNHNI